MVMNPYRSDTRQLAQYGEEDDTNAPDTGAPPRPQPYRPATQQPKRDEQGQRPLTFSQMQDAGEARPPMPQPQAPQVAPPQPYRPPQGVSQVVGGMANASAPAAPRFGDQAPLQAQGLAQNAPQGGVGTFGAGAGGKVFNEDGSPVDPATFDINRLTPEARQRLASGFAVRLMPGGGASYIHTSGVDPSTLSVSQGDPSGKTVSGAASGLPYTGPVAPTAYGSPAPAGANLLTPEDQEQFPGGIIPESGGASVPGVTFTPPPVAGQGPISTPAPAAPSGGLDPNTGGPTAGTPTPGAPTGQAPSGGSGFLQDLLPMLFGGANRQNPYGTQQVKDSYDWLGGQIDDQYDVQRQQLGEEMARRGLGASTIYGGRLNDLNIGQRTARQNLGYDLTQRQAEGESQASRDRLDYIRSLIGYGQQGFENDMSTAEFDRRSNNDYEEFIRWLIGQGG